jgi:excisionase family DNA binding protein
VGPDGPLASKTLAPERYAEAVALPAPTLLDPSDPAGEIVFVAVPQVVSEAVTDLLVRLGQGHVVAVSSVPEELSLQQAGELSGLERAEIVALLEAGTLPHTSSGGHRRVRRDDLLRWLASR